MVFDSVYLLEAKEDHEKEVCCGGIGEFNEINELLGDFKRILYSLCSKVVGKLGNLNNECMRRV